jgi:hypothetical protein
MGEVPPRPQRITFCIFEIYFVTVRMRRTRPYARKSTQIGNGEKSSALLREFIARMVEPIAET